jgi:hypothetical protein
MDTLEDIWQSIQDAVPGYVVGAIIILIVGWFVAWLLSKVVAGGLRRSGLGQRMGRHMGGRDETGRDYVADTAGRIVFYLIMLFVVIAVLDRLQLQLATEPMSALLAGIFGFIPNLVGAIVLALLAFILANILRAIVFQFARTASLDERLRAAETGERRPAPTAQPVRAREPGEAPAPAERYPLSRGLADAAYILVFLLFLPAILDALQLGGLLEPVNVLLSTIFAFIPNLIAAVLILIIGWFIARIISRIVTNFLAGAGFDQLPERLGFGATATAPAGWAPSRIAGTVVLVVIVWFALIQALEVLRFQGMVILLTALLVLAGRILLGLLIIGVGVWLARVAARAIRGSGVQQPNLLAIAAQASIILLFGAMGLRQMGVANSIINLAFAILLGAIGVAVAIAFGLGGRNAAGRLTDRWVARTETEQLIRPTMPEGGTPPAPERRGPTT